MRLQDILRFALENILRGGRKARLSVLAVAIGIFSVCLITAAGDVAAGEIENRIDETGLGGLTVFPSKAGECTITQEQIEMLPSYVRGLRAVTPFSMENAALTLHGKQRTVALIGVNEDIAEVFDLELLHGRMLSAADRNADTAHIVIDANLARALYERSNIIGKKLQLGMQGKTVPAEVVGIIASQKEGLESMLGFSMPSLIYIPHSFLETMTGKPQIGQIAISCFAGFEEDRVAEETARYLSLANKTKYKFENLNRYISSLTEIIGILRLFIQTVAGISLIVGGLGIMNSMLYIIDARQNEIGICKALGEPSTSILFRFLCEAVFLCLFGSAIGISSALSVTKMISMLTGLQLSIPIGTCIESSALALLCGVLSGILPAYRASRLDPIDVIIR